jgi:hypothetical protein
MRTVLIILGLAIAIFALWRSVQLTRSFARQQEICRTPIASSADHTRLSNISASRLDATSFSDCISSMS